MAADEEVNTRMSDDQVLASVFSLLIWLYQIDLPISSRQAIEQQMRSGWQNQDLSEQQLVSCLLQMNQTVIQSGDPDCHLVNTWEIFKNAFAPAECTPPDQLDDKSRLLVVIHRAIESIRPGSTGVAASVFPPKGNAWQSNLTMLTTRICNFASLKTDRSSFNRRLGTTGACFTRWQPRR